MNAPAFTQLVVLSEFLLVLGFINGVGSATAFAHDAEHRDIAGPVGDINHVAERNTPIFLCDFGIHVDRLQLVRSFVNLENVAGLDRIIDHYADLADLCVSLQFELFLLVKVRG